MKGRAGGVDIGSDASEQIPCEVTCEHECYQSQQPTPQHQHRQQHRNTSTSTDNNTAVRTQYQYRQQHCNTSTSTDNNTTTPAPAPALTTTPQHQHQHQHQHRCSTPHSQPGTHPCVQWWGSCPAGHHWPHHLPPGHGLLAGEGARERGRGGGTASKRVSGDVARGTQGRAEPGWV